MGYRVVCISGTDGAGAEQAAELVADALGFSLINEHIVTRAAAEAGVDPAVVADVERRKSILSKLLEGMGPAGMAASQAMMYPEDGAWMPDANAELRDLIRSAIEDTASGGNAVIVAHAASLALGGRDDVLRILITASTPTRKRRLAAGLQVDEKKAEGMIKRFDAGRADYVKRFYGIAAEQPTHYDLVINTDKLKPDEAARLIIEAARASD